VLAKLSVRRFLTQVAPAAESFHLITQNVDGLSARALRALKATDQSSPDSLIEMHGRLFDVQCTKCDHVTLDFSSPLCPALGEADRRHADLINAGSKEAEVPIPLKELPRCAACGSLARPGVVWFGESIPLLPQIDELVSKADLCLVVGTSSVVCTYDTAVSLSPSKKKTLCSPCEAGLPRGWLCMAGQAKLWSRRRLQYRS